MQSLQPVMGNTPAKEKTGSDIIGDGDVIKEPDCSSASSAALDIEARKRKIQDTLEGINETERAALLDVLVQEGVCSPDKKKQTLAWKATKRQRKRSGGAGSKQEHYALVSEGAPACLLAPQNLAKLGLRVGADGSVSCRELQAAAPYLANQIGWEKGGILKYSIAAKAMSTEARAYGGGVPKMSDGGVSASLQSIGATGYVKPMAATSLRTALGRYGSRTIKN